MPARSKARKRALDILFEAEQRGLPALELLAERQSLGEQPVPEYAAELVRGVAAHSEQIDSLISRTRWTGPWSGCRQSTATSCGSGSTSCCGPMTCPTAWRSARRSLLAQDLSTDASPAFVNGLLAKIKDLKPTLTLEA